MEPEAQIAAPNKIRYRWPWILAAFIVVGIALACFWMSREIARTQRIRDANAPTPGVLR